jgi:hypothetical protein
MLSQDKSGNPGREPHFQGQVGGPKQKPKNPKFVASCFRVLLKENDWQFDTNCLNSIFRQKTDTFFMSFFSFDCPF